jgi:2'-5' RNA ligase
LELSEDLKGCILALSRSLEARGVRARWVKSPTMHLTLKFLGDVDEELVPDVVRAVEDASGSVPAFVFETGGLGAFPSPRRARVIWLGVEPVDEMFDLHEGIEKELEALGFARERRPFRPHLTIGRIRERGGASVEGILSELAAPAERVEVGEVLVVKSTLRPSGAVHEVLAAVPLAGGPSPD